MSTAAVPVQRDAPRARRAWWGDLGIKVKVLTAVAVAALVAVLVGVLGLLALDSSADTTQRIYRDNLVDGVALVSDLRGTLKDTQIANRNAILAVTAADTDKAVGTLADLQGTFDATMGKYTADGMTAEKKAKAADVADAYHRYVEQIRTVLVPYAEAKDIGGWLQANSGQVKQYSDAALASMTELVDAEKAEAAASAAEARDAASR